MQQLPNMPWCSAIRLTPAARYFIAMMAVMLLKHLMEACLALVLAVMLWSQWRGLPKLLVNFVPKLT